MELIGKRQTLYAELEKAPAKADDQPKQSDAVWHDAAKLRAHLEGVRIECEYARGGQA